MIVLYVSSDFDEFWYKGLILVSNHYSLQICTCIVLSVFPPFSFFPSFFLSSLSLSYALCSCNKACRRCRHRGCCCFFIEKGVENGFFVFSFVFNCLRTIPHFYTRIRWDGWSFRFTHTPFVASHYGSTNLFACGLTSILFRFFFQAFFPFSSFGSRRIENANLE